MPTLSTALIPAPTPEIQILERQALDEFALWLLSSTPPRETLELLAGHIALSVYRNVTELATAEETHLAGIIARIVTALEQAQADEAGRIATTLTENREWVPTQICTRPPDMNQVRHV